MKLVLPVAVLLLAFAAQAGGPNYLVEPSFEPPREEDEDLAVLVLRAI